MGFVPSKTYQPKNDWWGSPSDFHQLYFPHDGRVYSLPKEIPTDPIVFVDGIRQRPGDYWIFLYYGMEFRFVPLTGSGGVVRNDPMDSKFNAYVSDWIRGQRNTPSPPDYLFGIVFRKEQYNNGILELRRSMGMADFVVNPQLAYSGAIDVISNIPQSKIIEQLSDVKRNVVESSQEQSEEELGGGDGEWSPGRRVIKLD